MMSAQDLWFPYQIILDASLYQFKFVSLFSEVTYNITLMVLTMSLRSSTLNHALMELC